MTDFSDLQLTKLMKLSNVTGLGPVRMLYMLDKFENIDAIFEASSNDLLRTKGFTENMLKEFERLKNSSDERYLKTIKDCTENKITIFTIKDKEYPAELKNIPSPPIFLFLLGNVSLLKEPKIAIVGTREPSQKAKTWGQEIGKELSKKFTIVSGGAKGTDTVAHRSALDFNQKTISVLGTGFFNFYPEENISLFQEIKEKGLLISEYSPNFKGSDYSFVQRNRITSGLSKALVNIASSKSGGAMIQTKIAAKQKIHIFVPSISLDILPNDGIKDAIANYGAIEIKSAEEILKKMSILQ